MILGTLVLLSLVLFALRRRSGSLASDPRPSNHRSWWLLAMIGVVLVVLLGVSFGLACRGGEAVHTLPAEVRCWVLAPVPGPEDLVLDRNHERLLVSSRSLRETPEPDGALWSVPLDPATRDKARALPLVGRDGCSFRPQGLDLLTVAGSAGADAVSLLYVVNHHAPEDVGRSGSCLLAAEPGKAATSVEVFMVEKDRLRFLQRLADPKVLTHGNDLVVLPNRDVWVTVPPATARELLREWWFRDESRLAHFRCQSREATPPADVGEAAAEPLICNGTWESLVPGAVPDGAEPSRRPGFVNGIAFEEPDRLIVASTFDDALFVYRIDHHENRTDLQPLRLLGHGLVQGPDNLSWGDGGKNKLLVAGHLDSRRFLGHRASSQELSPWGVWSIPTDGSGGDTLLQGDGHGFSAVSVAVPFGGDLMLGQIFDSGLMRCRVSVGGPAAGPGHDAAHEGKGGGE